MTVRAPPLDRSWLGLTLTEETVRRMESIGVDPCGEFGEYHTFVVDCPIYKKRIRITKSKMIWKNQKGYFEIKKADFQSKAT